MVALSHERTGYRVSRGERHRVLWRHPSQGQEKCGRETDSKRSEPGCHPYSVEIGSARCSKLVRCSEMTGNPCSPCLRYCNGNVLDALPPGGGQVAMASRSGQAGPHLARPVRGIWPSAGDHHCTRDGGQDRSQHADCAVARIEPWTHGDMILVLSDGATVVLTRTHRKAFLERFHR
jgi:hypothetical protein